MFVIPKISEQEAESIFFKKKKFSPLRLKKIALVPERLEMLYLPFYFFQISVRMEAKKQSKKFAQLKKINLSVDGLLGHSVFYVQDDLDFESGKKSEVCEFELTPAGARKVVLSEYRAFLLEHGLRTHSASQTEEVSGEKKIFYPFWVGYIQKRGRYDFIALDAVSGEIQGIKMRKVFLKAFRSLT
jgi:hypothetical protein